MTDEQYDAIIRRLNAIEDKIDNRPPVEVNVEKDSDWGWLWWVGIIGAIFYAANNHSSWEWWPF